MDIHQALDGRVVVFKPAGHIVGGDEAERIVDTAKNLIQSGNRALLVDLDAVDYVNSLGLGVFTRLVVAYSRANGSMKVCNVKGRVRSLFDIVRFAHLFNYYESERAALDAFAAELANRV
jgi:anti-anti-sigma factor